MEDANVVPFPLRPRAAALCRLRATGHHCPRLPRGPPTPRRNLLTSDSATTPGQFAASAFQNTTCDAATQLDSPRAGGDRGSPGRCVGGQARNPVRDSAPVRAASHPAGKPPESSRLPLSRRPSLPLLHLRLGPSRAIASAPTRALLHPGPLVVTLGQSRTERSPPRGSRPGGAHRRTAKAGHKTLGARNSLGLRSGRESRTGRFGPSGSATRSTHCRERGQS